MNKEQRSEQRRIRMKDKAERDLRKPIVTRETAVPRVRRKPVRQPVRMDLGCSMMGWDAI